MEKPAQMRVKHVKGHIIPEDVKIVQEVVQEPLMMEVGLLHAIIPKAQYKVLKL